MSFSQPNTLGMAAACPRLLRMRSYPSRPGRCNSFAIIWFAFRSIPWHAPALPLGEPVLGDQGMTIQSSPEGIRPMEERRASYDYEDLLACGRGELFGEGNAQLPLPPMLM